MAKPIEAGTELFLDYGDKFFPDDERNLIV
jgi:hypothetical protein